MSDSKDKLKGGEGLLFEEEEDEEAGGEEEEEDEEAKKKEEKEIRENEKKEEANNSIKLNESNKDNNEHSGKNISMKHVEFTIGDEDLENPSMGYGCC